MTEVLTLPSSPSTENPSFHSQSHSHSSSPSRASASSSPSSATTGAGRDGDVDSDSRVTKIQEEELKKRQTEKEREEFSLLALLFAVIRKSLIVCRANGEKLCVMEIGLPTDVRHVAHVTFDRFNGFLGLPDEFEPEVPRRAPSASTSVFGVSTESMQLSHDFRGNCVPTILILMQRSLYAQGGLQAEGIFRINADNDQEEYVRNELNRGVIPDHIDVHCLAGLIKAWFRELPSGVLDPVSPERMMQCTSEEDCSELVRILPPAEAAILDWAINLMADVVQEEQFNKMNAHNIAMVFAPNMTQMAEPLTALMYAVQVMNFLKTLITKTLRERQESRLALGPTPCIEPSDGSGHQSPEAQENFSFDVNDRAEIYSSADNDEPTFGSSHDSSTLCCDESDDSSFQWDTSISKVDIIQELYTANEFSGQPTTSTVNSRKENMNPPSVKPLPLVTDSAEKSKASSNLKLVSSRIERIEAWR